MNKSAFIDMQLSPGMLETLAQVGFDIPTPIQMKSIPELLKGRDLLGQAQTGTGKTAAFAVPLIETVDDKKKEIQALIVCPTRELCLQVSQELKRLSSHNNNLAVTALYGGQAIEQQFKSLKSLKPQIIVATPGRLFDHIRRGSIDLSTVNMIVLDEADEMLDMGFREEIEQIFDLLPEENQRIFFSATMPKAIMELVHNYLRDPAIIKIESKNLTVAKTSQSYFRVRPKEKTEILCRVLDYYDPKLAVVFTNAKSTADEVADEIRFRGFEAGVLHGDLSQNQRDRVMAKFKSSRIRVLVATDIAARGIDIDDVELVFNYHLPHDPEDYVHRIGRTGRAGREGRAVSLVEPRDNSRLRKIAQFARTDIAEQEPPTLNEVRAAKMANLFAKVKSALNSEMIGEYKSFISKQTLPSDDVAAGLIKIALEKFDENSYAFDLDETIRRTKYSGFKAERRRDGRESHRNGPRHRSFEPKREFRGDDRGDHKPWRSSESRGHDRKEMSPRFDRQQDSGRDNKKGPRRDEKNSKRGPSDFSSRSRIEGNGRAKNGFAKNGFAKNGFAKNGFNDKERAQPSESKPFNKHSGKSKPKSKDGRSGRGR